MDEPFGAIDPINRRILQDFFLKLQSELKRTVVFVTHDIGEAVKLGDRIAIMREGHLVQVDATHTLMEHPADAFVEDLLGSTRSTEQTAVLSCRSVRRPGFHGHEPGGAAGRRSPSPMRPSLS